MDKIRRTRDALWIALAAPLCAATLAGCHGAALAPLSATALAPEAPFVSDEAIGEASVAIVPSANPEWTWEQIVDVIDDYFRIERERPVQWVGDVVTEGRIDVFPQLSGTALEPHRADSVGAFQCWESTLQTIRRRAYFTVTPVAAGYEVRATVFKDIEDLSRPEEATAGGAIFRNDGSLPTRSDFDVSRTELSNAWIELGRDPLLERQILAEITARLGG